MVSLPYYLKRHIADLIKTHIREIRESEDIEELHCLLDSQLWNFIDYHLLEYLVNKLGSITLRSEMAEYMTELSNFMRKTTISSLIRFWPGRKESPPKYEKVSAKLDLNPNKCTLEQLNIIRTRLCNYFLPPLSEFAMLFYKVEEGSILVTWLIAKNLIPTLIKRLCSSECYKSFEEYHVVSLCIKEISVYPLSINEPPPKYSISESKSIKQSSILMQ